MSVQPHCAVQSRVKVTKSYETRNKTNQPDFKSGFKFLTTTSFYKSRAAFLTTSSARKSATLGITAQNRVESQSRPSRERSSPIDWDVEWERASKFMQSNTDVTVEVVMANRGGVMAKWGKLRGFIPKSQLDPTRLDKVQGNLQEVDKLAKLVGQKFSVKIMEVNPSARQMLLSERAALKEKGMSHLELGGDYAGRVRAFADYGAFITLAGDKNESLGVDGLVHISEISWDSISHPRDVLSIGEQVQVKVIAINEKKGQVSLSIRQLLADPLLETLDTLLPINAAEMKLEDEPEEEAPPFPGLEQICATLLAVDGVHGVTPGRQVLESRVVSQDLELWLTNIEVDHVGYNLIVRDGRQVQELKVYTSLEREQFKEVVRQVSAELLEIFDR